MSTEIYGATDYIGGGAGALDKISVATLGELDHAQIMTASVWLPYYFDSDSAAAENSPWVIDPDDSVGNERWVMIDVHATGFEATVASGDPKLVFDIAGTDEWYIGVDDNDADANTLGFTEKKAELETPRLLKDMLRD